MISVAAALENLFALVSKMPVETIPLSEADGRTLAQTQTAKRDQPPFAASAMDGYAIRNDDLASCSAFTVVGEAAAGHRFTGQIEAGQACRIFTGAPLPEGTDRVIIQEDVDRNGDRIRLRENLDSNHYVRPAGADFKSGDDFAAPRVLSPSDIALLAAMNIAEVPVFKKPNVAIIATGDELVQPGENPGPDQIIASNSYGLAALIRTAGGHPRLLPIACDTHSSLATVFDLAAGADLIITIGGASVGDHDLVAAAAENKGLDRSFYKVAMRPGKPLMAGKIGNAAMIGLPGNPVSAMVCGHVFIKPVLAKLLGQSEMAAKRTSATLSEPINANGPREHYMRANLIGDQVSVFKRQDSALLTVLADANCLVVRQPNAPALTQGDQVDIIRL